MAKVRQYRGGSIFSFVLVTVVVALLLIGSVAWLRHRGEVVRQEESLAQQEAPAPVQDTQKDENKSEAPAGTNGGAGRDGQSTESGTQHAASTPEVLPETGASEFAAAAVALSVIAYISTSYLMSRRAFRAEAAA